MQINHGNFIQIAMKFYQNPQCHSVEEFNEDLKIFFYLNKIFYRYNDRKELNEMLLVNRIITCFNIFGNATVSLLFFKICEEYRKPLITTLRFLNRMPNQVNGIDYSNYESDQELMNKLKSKI